MSEQRQNILVTGGAGYVGSQLIPNLLNKGHKVTVYDAMFYGSEHLPLNHENLQVVEGDIRDTDNLKKYFHNIDTVLHLACMSNDPSFELEPDLSKSINYSCFEPMVLAAKNAGVGRFIYCSSSSVYGVSEDPNVTEDHPLLPLTDYNKYKGLCEPLLFKHQSADFTCVTIRPATVCGYAPRCRLDLSVNILTNHAVNKGVITVFGGVQKRPNLHVKDMCTAYEMLITAPQDKIQGETFNAGYQNLSIDEIALLVKKVVEEEFPEKSPIPIKHTSTDDIRSYHINSDKIKNKLGFVPQYTIEDAVRSLCVAFRAGKLPNSFDDDRYYNVRTMKESSIV